MSADLLRRAAAKIREAAAIADPGPWDWMDGNAIPGPGWTGEPEWFIDSAATLIAHGPIKQANAEHIALWSPEPALLVAYLLDDAARRLEEVHEGTLVAQVAPLAVATQIALARLILKEEA